MPTFFLNLLNNYENKAIIYKYHKFALVAQLDRVFGYEPKGRGFESLPACQKYSVLVRGRSISFSSLALSGECWYNQNMQSKGACGMKKFFIYMKIFGAVAAAFFLVVDVILTVTIIADTGEMRFRLLRLNMTI